MADLQGIKYRTVGLATEVMQNMGLAVTQIPGGEIIPAMERGVIDAFEFNNPSSDRLLGAPDVAKHYMMGSYHQANEFFEIIFNQGVYDGLAAGAAGDPEIRRRGGVVGHAVEGVRPLLEGPRRAPEGRTGSRSTARRQDVFAAELEAWDKVVESFSQDDFFKRVIASQKEWAQRVGYYTLYNNVDTKLAYEHYFGSLTF